MLFYFVRRFGLKLALSVALHAAHLDFGSLMFGGVAL
jgi:hypothetical protein